MKFSTISRLFVTSLFMQSLLPLTIIINDLNDHQECNATIRSIHDTAGTQPIEVIVIDDCSNEPFCLDKLPEDSKLKVVVIHNTERQGCGLSRHTAALQATGEYLLIIDSHMRFTPGWFEEAKRIVGRPNTVHCATCLGLNAENMDVSKPCGEYTGATLNIYGDDPNKPGAIQVFEGIWRDHPNDDCELPCMMGACYFIPRELFFRLGGLNALKEWGSDEPFFSLKAWLAGCEVRLIKTVRIGHKFRSQQPYKVYIASLYYNKIRVFLTCMNEPEAAFLIARMPRNPEFAQAMQMIQCDREEIQKERALYRTLFVHDLRWYCDKFSINYPMG